MTSRSNEKERSELKGGFRGFVNMNGGDTTTILKAREVIALSTTSQSLKALTISYYFI